MKRAILLLVLVFASFAHADRKKAEQLFRAGEQAFRKQQYAAAAENFEAAYRAAEIPEIAFSAAQSYRRQWFIDREPKPATAKRAIELYRVYLENVKQEGRRGDASDGIAEMQRELDKLAPSVVAAAAPPPPKTRLAVSAVVAGEETKRVLGDLSPLPSTEALKAKATLDGKPVDLYVPVEVTPGEHFGEVVAEGYVSQRTGKQIIEGTNEVIEVVLQPKPATLVVRTSGRILIDGVRSDARRDLPAGKHVVTVLRRGYEPSVREVSLSRGETRTIDIDLERTRQRRAVPWLFVTSGGFVVVGGVMTVLAIHYDDKMSDIDEERRAGGIDAGRYDDYKTATQRRDTTRTLAFIAARPRDGGRRARPVPVRSTVDRRDPARADRDCLGG